MQRKGIIEALEFFTRLYKHLDGVDYIPGIQMLFVALPISLQAHLIESHDANKLPNPDVFDDFGLDSN